MDDQDAALRRGTRYNHVTITLWITSEETRRDIRALDWNEKGFSFFFDRQLPTSIMQFRKGTLVFDGELVWRHANTDEAYLREMLLNRLLSEKVKQIAGDRATAKRIVQLIRAHGMIAEKTAFLEKVDPTERAETVLRRLMDAERESHPVYRYGVRVESSEWNKIVKIALETTEVVLLMNKIEAGLSKATQG